MTAAHVPPEVREFLQPETARDHPRKHIPIAKAGIDRYCETWRVLAGFLHAEIEELRTAIEAPGLDALETERLRGQIVAHRLTLSIGDIDQSMPIDRQNLRAGY